MQTPVRLSPKIVGENKWEALQQNMINLHSVKFATIVLLLLLLIFSIPSTGKSTSSRKRVFARQKRQFLRKNVSKVEK